MCFIIGFIKSDTQKLCVSLVVFPQQKEINLLRTEKIPLTSLLKKPAYLLGRTNSRSNHLAEQDFGILKRERVCAHCILFVDFFPVSK